MRHRSLQLLALAVTMAAVLGWGGCARQSPVPATAPPVTIDPSAASGSEPPPPPIGPPVPRVAPPRLEPAPFPESVHKLTAPDGVQVILLLGADDRPGSPGRSDSMVLAAVDSKTRQVRLLSLPRDGWAYIPGRGWDKWNSAYAYGHERLARQTVERMLGVRVDHTAVVTFQGFERIVDALGGVDVTIDHNLNYDDPWDKPPLHIHLKAGAQHLNGEQTLQMARFRHDSENDWGRIKRQQELAHALLQAALRPQVITRLPALVSALSSAYRTDLSVAQELQLALLVPRLSGNAVSARTIPGSDFLVPTLVAGGDEEEVWYTFLDLEQARQDTAWLVLGKGASGAYLDESRRLAAVYQQAQPPRD